MAGAKRAWWRDSGSTSPLKGAWFRDGGTTSRVKAAWYRDGGTTSHSFGWVGEMYPNIDEETSGWTSTPLYQKIDEEPYSDADFISSSLTAGIGAESYDFRVGLSSPTNPPYAGNGITLYVRARKQENGACTVDLRIELREGATTVRAYADFDDIGTSWTTRSIVLSATEINAITNWDVVQVYVKATQSPTSEEYDCYTDVSYIRLKST